jgi:hypothetical protein
MFFFIKLKINALRTRSVIITLALERRSLCPRPELERGKRRPMAQSEAALHGSHGRPAPHAKRTAYRLADLDGTVSNIRFAAFRLIPYPSRSRCSIPVTCLVDRDDLARVNADEDII